MRVILHSDLNNFFASVECLLNPRLRDVPLAVCGSQEKRHGIVLSKNEIAKRFGVKTAVPIWQAKQLCPNLVTIEPHHDLYIKYSRMVQKIYCQYTDLVEPFGIDECWLDVTESQVLFGDGEAMAYKIKERIKKEIGLTCSIGVSYNKVFAKLGSDMKKPDAVTVITPDDVVFKIFPLPCKQLLSVGGKVNGKLNDIGVYTIGDIASASPGVLENLLGKGGRTLWNYANGLDNSSVHKYSPEDNLKSVGNAMTTPTDLKTEEEARRLLFTLSESVGQRLRKYGLVGRTVQITIKSSDFHTIERQGQLEHPSNISSEIYQEAFNIFKHAWKWEKDIRLLGVRVTNLEPPEGASQISLFTDKGHLKKEQIEHCLDKIKDKYGNGAVGRALMLEKKRS